MKQGKYQKRFVDFVLLGLGLLLLLLVLSLALGARSTRLDTVWQALVRYDRADFNQVTVRDIRLPRFLADIIVGACLALSGVIMQGTTKNGLADSGLMGISAGATVGVVFVMAFFPMAGRFEKMGISALGAAAVTVLIYAIAYCGRGRMTSERLVLSGMAISTFLSSLTTAVILKYGLSNQMVRYMSGSSANIIWKDLAIAVPVFLVATSLALAISRWLTVMNLGEDVSIGLGLRLSVARLLATLVVLLLSAVAVIVIGPVGYVGLMVPYAARSMAGTDYRYLLPLCAIYGAVFVAAMDLLARTIRPGLEFPIGLLMTLVGAPFFVYLARQQKGEWTL